MLATSTLNQSWKVSFLTWGWPFLKEKGQSLFQNSTTMERMAPSWMTTRNISLNAGVMSMWMNSSASIMWPVLETGSHSVSPSMIPKMIAFKMSHMAGDPSLRSVFLPAGRRRNASLSIHPFVPLRVTILQESEKLQIFPSPIPMAAGRAVMPLQRARPRKIRGRAGGDRR